MQKVHTTRLANGVEIIIVPDTKSFSVAAGIFVRTGSMNETKNNNGISHFLEHMFFKGTPARPTPLAIATSFERLGAVNNAFTSYDVTAYWAKVARRHFDTVFGILIDMFLNPLFKREELEKEKGVIIEEIGMYEDDPQSKVWDMLSSAMYPSCAAGRNVAGTVKTVGSFTRGNLLSYHQKYYTGGNVVIVIAGNIAVSHGVKLVRDAFSSLKKQKTAKKSPVVEVQRRHVSIALKRVLDQTHLAIGFKAFPYASPDKYALMVFSDILGGGMSSRLFQRVREDLGAAYYVFASPMLEARFGALGIGAGVTPSKLPIVLKAIGRELSLIAKERVGKEELTKSKEHLIGKFLLSLETADDLAMFYGKQVVMGEKILTPEALVGRIKKVSANDVLSVARRVIRRQKSTLSILGPHIESRSAQKYFLEGMGV